MKLDSKYHATGWFRLDLQKIHHFLPKGESNHWMNIPFTSMKHNHIFMQKLTCRF